MTKLRTSVLALLVSVSSLSTAAARDFFVQATTAGPVKAAALASISIPGSTTASAGQTVSTTTTRVRDSTAGKWVSARTSTTTAASTTTTSSTTTTPTSPPWKSFSSLINSGQVQGGDRIYLLDGYHGAISIRDQKFTAPVLIAPMPGSVAHADAIQIQNSSNLVFNGLSVWPRPGVNAAASGLVRSYGTTSDLVFTNMDVRSADTAPAYKSWGAATWQANDRVGYLIDGNRVTVTNNRATGIRHGMVVMADNALVEKNIVDGFSGDGMRALGDNSIVRSNLIQNCVNYDGNHPDGFQSYSRGPTGKPGTGTLLNLVLENNRIFESVGTRMALACNLQGIGMFDGMFDGLRIENNIVVSSAPHGLTVAGATNTIIRHNTVVAASGLAGKQPWIRLGNHKNGTPSKNVQIVNNFATNFTMGANTAIGNLVANNVRVGAATTEFVGFSTQNLKLKAGSKGIDAGDPKKIAVLDVMGVKRWLGKAPDVGAYESQ